jgi:Zn finger protein HypA/HybF involved in hydrogenase expression
MTNIDTIRNLPDSELLEIGADGNIRGTLKILGFKDDPRLRTILIDRFKQLGIERNKYKRYDYSIEDVRIAVKESLCMMDAVKKVGLTPHTTNAQHIRRLMDENDISDSHFNVNQARKRGKMEWTKENIFCENSGYHRSMLRGAISRFNIIEEYKCSKCGITDWHGEPLTIELDHINGINNDNRPENLRWLCPNCHSQTPTHKNGKKP